MIPVTRPFLPPRDRLEYYLDRVYASRQLTNNGPLVQELTSRLEEHLGVENMLLVGNGTLAIQIAAKALGINGGTAVTTPFTFPATSSALAWQGVEPRYADIDSATLNLDPASAAQIVDASTNALVPVHTYGNPCAVEAFEDLARKRNLKLIYDASHAFGVDYKGRSLLRWGHAATISFHATKLFHSGEGGAVVFRDSSDLEVAHRMINFGFRDGMPVEVGINAKMSELHAAMGLAVLESVDEIIEQRCAVRNQYRRELGDWVEMPEFSADASLNGAYAPILCRDMAHRNRVREQLARGGYDSRGYFYPALGTLGLYSRQFTDAGRQQADRVLCLPIFVGLTSPQIHDICNIVKSATPDK
ncbi:DegT/DnrJ/EryC1/StrS family aminotransferase [Marinobacter halodurans]|uniref:DegT/DnrJ/EryC1/StrS family aminotransferase n=1 Tax=Marinobacter halodurans TaxID=2528979 RepID=A0ABY1ZLD9_9GAMM|nr:DegT/DnrJ/EryC1/StrS family aminotransferase [Marinobacter halodurans]TBW56655.1 DegT/DnrJ/EryC1/StrS family aminotransferase [Marinobacter halodurans]